MVLFTVIGGEGRRDGQLLSADQTRGLLQAVNLTASSPAAVFLIGKDGRIKLTEHGRFQTRAVTAICTIDPNRLKLSKH